MPTPISLALCSLFLFMIMDLIIGLASAQEGDRSLYGVVAEIVLALAIIVGTMKSIRPAWQAGRLLGLLGAVFYAFLTVRIFLYPKEYTLGLGDHLVELSALAVQTVCLAVVPFAFATHAARGHFDLICPRCGEDKTSTGLFVTSVHCKNCNANF